ncbi:MAG TPA: pyrroloquinoline quinone biosynthesis protein PqqE [Polyangiaceae bacterium]|nr:pyrroloquinoline quinone biosynthesis protein PqqE [Polyangiaceae bacterium]
MTKDRPYTLIAELTYRCPLRCVYCSNPVDFARHKDALSTEDWKRVLTEADELGAMQLNLTGGEPLVRTDLEQIVAHAARLGLYTNLITSGLPSTRERLVALRDAGIDSLQLSIQDVEKEASERIAGRESFAHKLEVASWVRELGIPLTINTVLHRENIDHVSAVVALAERFGAERLELANAQYLAWALVNRERLLPTRAQLESARAHALSARERLKGKMEILFVLPDYYSDRPKACMSGWGKRYIVVSPDGLALPCHLAHTLPGLPAESVLERSLDAIWNDSPLFAAFRGDDWMREPCKSCERKSIDYGGCRCQAFHLTGNPAVTDPTCALSPHHARIEEARVVAERLVSASRLANKGNGADVGAAKADDDFSFRYREPQRAAR